MVSESVQSVRPVCDNASIADENPHGDSLTKCFTVLQSNTVRPCGSEHQGALNESPKNDFFINKPNNLQPWK